MPPGRVALLLITETMRLAITSLEASEEPAVCHTVGWPLSFAPTYVVGSWRRCRDRWRGTVVLMRPQPRGKGGGAWPCFHPPTQQWEAQAEPTSRAKPG